MSVAGAFLRAHIVTALSPAAVARGYGFEHAVVALAEFGRAAPAGRQSGLPAAVLLALLRDVRERRVFPPGVALALAEHAASSGASWEAPPSVADVDAVAATLMDGHGAAGEADGSVAAAVAELLARACEAVPAPAAVVSTAVMERLLWRAVSGARAVARGPRGAGTMAGTRAAREVRAALRCADLVVAASGIRLTAGVTPSLLAALVHAHIVLGQPQQALSVFRQHIGLLVAGEGASRGHTLDGSIDIAVVAALEALQAWMTHLAVQARAGGGGEAPGDEVTHAGELAAELLRYSSIGQAGGDGTAKRLWDAYLRALAAAGAVPALLHAAFGTSREAGAAGGDAALPRVPAGIVDAGTLLAILQALAGSGHASSLFSVAEAAVCNGVLLTPQHYALLLAAGGSAAASATMTAPTPWLASLREVLRLVQGGAAAAATATAPAEAVNAVMSAALRHGDAGAAARLVEALVREARWCGDVVTVRSIVSGLTSLSRLADADAALWGNLRELDARSAGLLALALARACVAALDRATPLLLPISIECTDSGVPAPWLVRDEAAGAGNSPLSWAALVAVAEKAAATAGEVASAAAATRVATKAYSTSVYRRTCERALALAVCAREAGLAGTRSSHGRGAIIELPRGLVAASQLHGVVCPVFAVQRDGRRLPLAAAGEDAQYEAWVAQWPSRTQPAARLAAQWALNSLRRSQAATPSAQQHLA